MATADAREEVVDDEVEEEGTEAETGSRRPCFVRKTTSLVVVVVVDAEEAVPADAPDANRTRPAARVACPHKSISVPAGV